MKLYELTNDVKLSTHAAAHYTRGEIAKLIRSNPHSVQSLLAGACASVLSCSPRSSLFRLRQVRAQPVLDRLPGQHGEDEDWRPRHVPACYSNPSLVAYTSPLSLQVTAPTSAFLLWTGAAAPPPCPQQCNADACGGRYYKPECSLDEAVALMAK